MRYLLVMIGCSLCLGLFACEDKKAAEKEKEMQAAVASLVQAERDFAATVKAEGIRAGFLSVLHPDGILFNPTPTNGLARYEAAGESGALLTWEPRYAELASSLDLGYTTGPWEYFTSDTAAEAVAFGDYFSIWKRDSAGVWKLVLDLGVSRSAPEPMHELKTKVLPAIDSGPSLTEKELRAVDSTFAEHSGREAKAAYAASAVSDARILRDGSPRVVGSAAIVAADLPSRFSFPESSVISKDGNIGYVYGRAEGMLAGPSGEEVAGQGGYVRIWRLEGDEHKLAAEVMSLRPKQ